MKKKGTVAIIIVCVLFIFGFSYYIFFIDREAPTATAIPQTITVYETIDSDSYVTDIIDQSEVEMSIENEPDFTVAGNYEVRVILTDESGNVGIVLVPVTIIGDTKAPEISGVKDQSIYVEQTISYKSGVEVMDDLDGAPILEIDNSQVDTKTPGEYIVTYTASDRFNNETIVTSMIKVEEKPEIFIEREEADELADQIIASIITEDMTDLEKLEAVYFYTKNKLGYKKSKNKEDYIKEAIRGIKESNGDCFTSYAIVKLLLDRLGYENIDVHRVEGSRRGSHHYWSLVKYNGEWYHYDASMLASQYTFICFLKTDQEVKEFSEIRPDYYYFDPEGLPATPTEPLNTGY